MSSFDAFPGKPTGFEVRWRYMRQRDGTYIVDEIYPDDTMLRWPSVPAGEAMPLIERRRAIVTEQIEDLKVELRARLDALGSAEVKSFAREEDGWAKGIREKVERERAERAKARSPFRYKR